MVAARGRGSGGEGKWKERRRKVRVYKWEKRMERRGKPCSVSFSGCFGGQVMFGSYNWNGNRSIAFVGKLTNKSKSHVY